MARPCVRCPVVAVLVLTLVVGAGACDSEGGGADIGARSGAQGPDTVAAAGFDEIPRIAAEIEPSVVTVVVGSSGIGSGVVYREGGYVVTNAHVVRSAERVQVELADGTRTPAEVLATDEITDIAVLRTERRDLPPARFQTRQPAVGELVLAVGSPLGFQNSVTAGIVSGLGREIPGAATAGARSLVDLIQTDAAISPGNSGGALVNGRGEVVGINEAYIPPSVGAVALGFAIPAATATAVADQLIEDGTATHPYLGVAIGSLTPQVDRAFGMGADAGAIILGVENGGPAGRAGLQRGDVIVRLGDEQIRSAEEFLGALRGTRPGQTVPVEIRRDGTTRTVDITIGTLPPQR